MKYKVYDTIGDSIPNTIVTAKELDDRYKLAFETNSKSDVMVYLADCRGTILVENSIADELPYYNYMCEIKNGDVELVDYER